MNFAGLANAAWLASSVPAWQRFRNALDEPEQVQKNILHRLLGKNADSTFGRAHGFDGIRCYEEYRERVPIADYDELEQWITRIQLGERAVLTSEPTTRLLPTSGSMGGRKLIPFNAAFQRELNAAIGPWMVDLFGKHPSIVAGPAYWSVSPAMEIPREDSAVPIGFEDDSAYLGGIRQRLVESVLAVPPALRLVRDVATHRYLTLLCLLRQPGLRLISVWHPSFLTLLLDALPTCWDELVRDVERGGCARAGQLPEAVLQAVAGSPQPGRARELWGAGPKDPHALWPGLRVVSCWSDAQATFPAKELQLRVPRAFLQPKGLLATEAVVSIPFRGLHPVAITSHFYEFADADGVIHLAHELRPGETYSVIVTTGGGLWRYPLGDLVEVDGLVGRTPSLRFLGRAGRISDLCGEKLSEAFVTRAIHVAFFRCGISPSFAMLAPEVAAGRRHYTLYFQGHESAMLAGRLDEELRANPHYALCRDLDQLGALQVLRVAAGAYEVCCASAAADGRRIGDVKPQSLSIQTDWRRRLAEHVETED